MFLSHPPLTCLPLRALRLHPDKGGDPELFKEVTHAYVSPIQVYLKSLLMLTLQLRGPRRCRQARGVSLEK